MSSDATTLPQQRFSDASPGARAEMASLWRWVVFVVGVGFSAFHLYTALFGTMPSRQQGPLHLALGLGLIFLLYPAKTQLSRREIGRSWALTLAGLGLLSWLVAADELGAYAALPAAGVLCVVQIARHVPVAIKGMPLADLVLAGLGFGSAFYLFWFADEIGRRAGIHNEWDLAAATVGILMVLVATQRVVGTPLVVVASVALAYAYWGTELPGFLGHSGYSVDRILSSSFLGTEGVFGTPIQISSTFIFLFMIFAAMLQRSGMERFFTQVAFGATGWMTGGPAKVGVLTSAFSATITGSSVANTVSNGAFTIPMMKRAGYKSEFAGAVEASSSTGGQLAPPIMGAAAFIMIDFTGEPYGSIITAAIIPAVLFFVAQFVVIHFESKRLGIMGLPRAELPSVPGLVLTKGYLILPIAVIFAILLAGQSPIRAATLAIGATIAVNLLAQAVAALLRRWHDLEDKLTLAGILNGFVDAARIALPIIAACASAGLIAGVITLTGVGLQLSSGLLSLAQDTLILTMLFSMVACLVLGIGLPTTANYVITATLAAPALLAFDPVPVLAAHFFVFYFGIMADITPPVALASYAASGISRSNPMRTGVQSARIALGGFLIPYMFVFSPELLLIDASWTTTPWVVLTAVVGVFSVGIAIAGYAAQRINALVRLVLASAGLLLIYGEPLTDALGLGGFGAVLLWQRWLARRVAAAQPVAADTGPTG